MADKYEGDVKVKIELVVYISGYGETDKEVIKSAENTAQAMDIEDIVDQLIYGYGVKHGEGEIEHIRPYHEIEDFL